MLSKNQSMNTSTSSNNNTVRPLSQTDPEAARQQAAANKLELFELIKEMQDGRLPRNQQLDSFLERLINNRVIRSREHTMSQDGKNLLNDFRALMETLRKTLQAKNKEELFQSYVYHLHCMDLPISKDQMSVDESKKNIVKQEGKKGSQALYNIGKLVLLNNEFRSLLGELIDISQNIFSNVTDQIGEDLKQTGDNLKNNMNTNESGKEKVDKVIMGDQHHCEEPHLINENASNPTHAGLLNNGDSVHPDMLPAHQGHIHQPTQRDTNQIMNEKLNQRQPNQLQTDQNAYYGTDNVGQHKDAMQQQVGDHTRNANQHFEKRKQGLNQTVQEHFDDDKQNELLNRLRAAIGQVQRHPKYQEAIVTLIGLIKSWSSRLTRASGNMKEHVQSQDNNEQASYRDQAETELKTLIEGWAQGRSIDPILESVKEVMDDAKNDETLRLYYDTALKYVQRLLRDPDYINSEESTEHGQELIDNGRQLMKGKYGEHYQTLSNHARTYMRLMADDDISRELNERFTQIHQDLWMDSDGNPAFKPHLINDMQKTLLPAFLDEIKYIPVPRIEFSDKQFDVTVEDLIISGDSLLPNFFDIKAESFSSFNFKSEEDTLTSHQSLLIHMSEIQADINNAVFDYKKKTGFPKVSDRGIASLTIDKKGISIVIRVQSTDNPAKTFKVTYCKCHVDHLKVKVDESKHDILYKAVLPLVMGALRKQIARTIEMKIIEILNKLDQRVTTSLVNMNQNLQNKAYEALPEADKANPNLQPEQLSQARPRPGLFSTLVTIINRNIQSKTEKRNMEKQNKKSTESPAASMKTDRYHALNYEPSSKTNSSYNRQAPSNQQSHFTEPDSTLTSGGLLNSGHTNNHQHIPINPADSQQSNSTGQHISGNHPVSSTVPTMMQTRNEQPDRTGQHISGNHPVSSTVPTMMQTRNEQPDRTGQHISGNHPVSSTVPTMMQTRNEQPISPSNKQFTDPTLGDQGFNKNPFDTTDSSHLRHEPRTMNLNDQYVQSNSDFANLEGQDKNTSNVPHPSHSNYSARLNDAFEEPSVTGTHNTPLNHASTVNQDSRLANRGIANADNSFTAYTLGARPFHTSYEQPDSANLNEPRSNFSQPVPKSNSLFDNSNNQDVPPLARNSMDSNTNTSSHSSNTVNSNGIDNQHFKLAMDLGEAQNPDVPLPKPSRQAGASMEGTHQL